MSYKYSTYASLALMVAAALLVLFTSGDLAQQQANQPVSPATFPRIVAILIVIVSGISFIKTYRQQDEKVEFVNLKYVLITIGLTLVFLALWQLFDLFFIWAFLLLTALSYLYSKNENKLKKILFSSSISLIVVAFVYFAFTRLLGVYF